MLSIKIEEACNENIGEIIDSEFSEHAEKNGLSCDYRPFVFVAKDGEKTVGIIRGHSYYSEVHISDLIVSEQYRKKQIGKRLVETVESHFKCKGFNNINLSTYKFQAPEFYKKLGYKLEFVREDKDNEKLTKYFFIKQI